MKHVLLAGIVLLGAFGLWVRLAPVDAGRWHVDPEAAPDPGPRGYRTGLHSPLPPSEALAAMARIIGQTARTRLLAGSPGDGRMTFETRSRWWGFPDYTTIAARPEAGGQGGSWLAISGRLRFGRSDLGVNRARIERWIAALERAVQ